MTDRRHILLLLCAFLTAASPAAGQDADLTQGVAAMTARDLPLARRHLETAARRDTTSYEANWRLATVLTDIGKQTPADEKNPARDSLYADAVTYARRAVAAKTNGSEGHFALAVALGRTALTLGARKQIRLAAEIHDEALQTIRLEPRHDGAYHVLGRWNAEIMRLPAFQKFFAKAFLGASIFDQASWEAAERYLRLSVQYNPRRITHRLDLALVQVDRAEWAAARAQIDTLLTLPLGDPGDPANKRQAQALATKIAGKTSR